MPARRDHSNSVLQAIIGTGMLKNQRRVNKPDWLQFKALFYRWRLFSFLNVLI